MIKYIESQNEDAADLNNKRWTTPFGDIRKDKEKDEDVVRVATHNIGGVPKMDRRGTTKFMRL